MSKIHEPVMLVEVLEAIRPRQGMLCLDATFGRGGHTQALLKKGAKVLAFDCDQTAIDFAKENFKEEIKRGDLIIVRENFDQLEEQYKKYKKNFEDLRTLAVLFDFGVSTDQLKDYSRGFSFESDEELDMRMDQRLKVKAADLLAVLSPRQLSQMFWEFGGEEKSRIIAREIIEARNHGKFIRTTKQLADLVSRVKRTRGKLHPATKVFQALRIAVNSELDSIKAALPQALRVLDGKGRIVTISFHEGEDRLVKHFFNKSMEKGLGEAITKKPIGPSLEEIKNNPNSRSAKLRIFELQKANS